MAKYRKKPVVVEAVQFDGTPESRQQIIAWTRGSPTPAYVERDADGVRALYIRTLEGNHRVSFGDYVIRGIQGEFYPCKPDIFETTYEPADAPSAASASLNAVYTERNRLIAALARAVLIAGGEAGLAGNPEDRKSPVVLIDIPGYGQVSWHLPMAEVEELFDWLGPYPGEWDGHTTDETYARLDAYARQGVEKSRPATPVTTVAMRTPQGATVRARVEPSPHKDILCPVCEALDTHLESVGIIDIRAGAECGVCGSVVHNAVSFVVPSAPGQPEAGQ